MVKQVGINCYKLVGICGYKIIEFQIFELCLQKIKLLSYIKYLFARKEQLKNFVTNLIHKNIF